MVRPFAKNLNFAQGGMSQAAPYTRPWNAWNKRVMSFRRLGEPLAERGGRARTYFKVEAPGVKALQGSYAALKRMAAGVKILPQLS